jgi:fumarylacetoacetate (FAA) hydrolase
MKLASLRTARRDGALVVCSRDLSRAVHAPIVATMQQALDAWDEVAPALQALALQLEAGSAAGAFSLRLQDLAAPLPRPFGWIDSSVYLNHMELSRRLRNAEMPAVLREEPHLSARVSDPFLGPCDSLPLPAGDVGLDIEGELAVILGDVPAGATHAEAEKGIRLVTLVNDTSLRTVYARDLARGKTAFHGKSTPSMAPVAVTPDELGGAWRDGTLHLDVRCSINDALLGRPNGGVDMAFSFPQIISHAVALRGLRAGTVLGSGTVSNRDRAVGCACIAERRMLETLDTGAPVTQYLVDGDRVRIEVLDAAGESVFGPIAHTVRSCA